MYIRPKTTRKQRPQPVTYGTGSHGKRLLVKAVMDAGYPKRLAEKAVDGIIAAWKRSLSAHKPVEMPIGTIKVRKTPKHFEKQLIVRKKGKDGVARLHRWNVYKDRYRVLWRAKRPDLLDLLRYLNPGMTEEELERDYVPSRKIQLIGVQQPPALEQRGAASFKRTPALISTVTRPNNVPSRTAVFKPR